MSEVFEEEKASKFDLGRYLDIGRRRHMYFLIPLLAGWLLVWAVSWFLPPRYKSSTQILVQEPSLPRNVADAAADQSALQARLQTMQQEILSRTRLLTIINGMHLYDDGGKPQSDDDKVATMTKAIDIDLVRDTHNSVTGFKISYSSDNARVAQAVTGQLAELFINENQKNQYQQSADTTRFLKSQLDQAAQTLADQEAKVKNFQATHIGALPDSVQSNLAILGGLQSQLNNEQDGLNNANQQRTLHEAEIEQYRANPVVAVRSGEVLDPNSVQAIDIQLAKLRDQLTDLTSRYTDSYPDVVKLKAQIAQVEQQRKQAMASPREKGEKTTDSLTVAQLQAQLQADNLAIQNRQKAIDSLKVRINEYEARINATPSSVQGLADLQRGYNQSQANYNDILKKMQESQMATNMEQMQQGERFQLLDPPSLPAKPDFPNRLLFCGVGLAVGLVFGAASVAGFEFMDDRLHSESEISDLLPVPVICEIPTVSNAIDEQVNRRKMLIGWATATVVAMVILAGSAISYLHG
ncbi:MAG TPA: Wzz/FepE/Etk N-terminal domain-containing protein [Acidobacteriaceae bacterium]|nr:Wzz/FepE/Etk N-terminal domain-containing protein [Acidobacteriaceae bacterium]